MIILYVMVVVVLAVDVVLFCMATALAGWWVAATVRTLLDARRRKPAASHFVDSPTVPTRMSELLER